MVRKGLEFKSTPPRFACLSPHSVLPRGKTELCVCVCCAFYHEAEREKEKGLRGDKRGVKEKTRGEGAYSLHHSGWDLQTGSSQLAVTTGSYDNCNNLGENQREREKEGGNEGESCTSSSPSVCV